MTREEAIARIKDHMSVHKIYEERAVKITEALDMAISALQQSDHIADGGKKDDHLREVTKKAQLSKEDATSDCISRQAAIDAIHEDILLKPLNDSWYRENHEFVTVGYVERTLLAVPSAQTELIEKAAYIRGFEQGRTQGMIDSQGGKK